MKTYMNINIRIFPVKIRDERSGLVMEDTIILEKSRLQAAQLVGLDSKDLIYRVYNRKGYKVLDIGTATKAEIAVDLKQVYTQTIESVEELKR